MKVGDRLKLSDKETLADAYEKNGVVSTGEFFEVVESKTFVEQNESVVIDILTLDSDNLFLVKKSSKDGGFYYILCYTPLEFYDILGAYGGDRQDLKEKGLTFFFEEEDVNNPSVLLQNWNHASTIYLNNDDDSLEFKAVHSTLYGEMGQFAAGDQDDKEYSLAAVTHLRATSETGNPELFLLEYGDIESDRGGYCTLLQGVILQDSEVEFL